MVNPIEVSFVSGAGPRATSRRMRVAVVCDFLEEQWPSMDLVGDMLYQHLAAGFSAEMEVTQVRPPMLRRFLRIPLLGRKLSLNSDRLVNRFWDYPRALREQRGRFDLFHLVDHSYSQLLHHLPPERTVVTCHDLDTFRCVLEPRRESRPRLFRKMTEKILEGFRKAAHIITVSEATRSELLQHGLASPGRVSVIPNGVHPAYSAAPASSDDAEAARLLPVDSSNGFWLLNVGSNAPRKRMDLLLKIFASIRRQIPTARLIRVGGPLTPEHFRMVRDLKLENAITVLPFLSTTILAAVYRRAALLLHTAESEGFGLPIIEAMASGCPVVATDLPVLREVAGNAATFCPLGDITTWTDSVVLLLSGKNNLDSRWRAQRLLALARAEQFQWTESVRQTAQVYHEVFTAATRTQSNVD